MLFSLTLTIELVIMIKLPQMNDISYSFYQSFSEDKFCLLYDGNILDEVTDKIIDLSEFNFENQSDYAKSRKKVSFLLAECFQNIIRHGGKVNREDSRNIDTGFFLTRNINDTYYITSANLIKKENISGLKERLNRVNSLDKDSLKALYLEELENKGFSEKGGAGLGLIEIARKSGQKIEFFFDDFEKDFSMFYNQVMLKSPKQFKEHSSYRLVEAMEFHKKMLSENIIMIQKGDFSDDSIIPILEILEKNLPAFIQQSNPRREAYHVLVELLQNISKYAIKQGDRKEGIFIIKKGNDDFIISAGNYIEKKHMAQLNRQLQILNSLNKKELKKKYLETLNEDTKEFRIELIEIARRSKEPLKFSFTEPNEGQCFFSISVLV